MIPLKKLRAPSCTLDTYLVFSNKMTQHIENVFFLLFQGIKLIIYSMNELNSRNIHIIGNLSDKRTTRKTLDHFLHTRKRRS